MMIPYYETEHGKIYYGNALNVLKDMPSDSVDMCVTSPPYWGLRSYGTNPQVWDGDYSCKHAWHGTSERPIGNNPSEISTLKVGKAPKGAGPSSEHYGQFCQLCGAWRGELGLEPTPELFVEHIVQVFREVRRVLKPEGTIWINIGDSYTGSANSGGDKSAKLKGPQNAAGKHLFAKNGNGLKPKDLVGIPWRVAFALQADGLWLRQDIVWHKPSPMPESITDRCTKAHEYLFLLSKSGKYYFDNESIKEPATTKPHGPGYVSFDENTFRNDRTLGNEANVRIWSKDGTKNKRSVWTIPTKPQKAAHFATFPPALIEPCILAGCPEGGTVLDPFLGAGTTAIVAHKHNRRFLGIELQKEYLDKIAIPRIERKTKQLKMF